MKKKLIFVTAIILVVCLCVTMFSGCFMILHLSKDYRDKMRKEPDEEQEQPIIENPRKPTLQLEDVKQLYDGKLALVIENSEVINYHDKVEITLDGGNSWQEASKEKILDYDYYYQLQEEDFGKEYKIAVRMAATDSHKEGAISNLINRRIKRINAFGEDMISGRFFLFMQNNASKTNQYVFVLQNGSLVLNKYCEDESGNLQIQAVEDKDKLNFEYLIFDADVAIKECQDMIDFISEKNVFGEYFDDRVEYYRFLDVVAVWLYYISIETNINVQNSEETLHWSNYDYQNGIMEEEYQKGCTLNVEYNYNSSTEDLENITLHGKHVLILIREKGNESTLESQAVLVGVSLQQ